MTQWCGAPTYWWWTWNSSKQMRMDKEPNWPNKEKWLLLLVNAATGGGGGECCCADSKSVIFAFIFYEMRSRSPRKSLWMLHFNLFGWIACKANNTDIGILRFGVLSYIFLSSFLLLVRPLVITQREREKEKRRKIAHARQINPLLEFILSTFLTPGPILIHQRNYNFALARSFATFNSITLATHRS